MCKFTMYYDEYREGRPRLKKDEGLIRSDAVYVQSHHLALTLDILKHQVLHHSFTQAIATMETVAMTMDQIPEVILKVGVAVLQQSGDGYRQTLRMLKLMFTWQPKHRETILLETAIYIARHGNLQEAYDTLQSQINGEPFKSSWMIHGYCGVLKYLMYQEKEVETEVDGGVAKEIIKQALHHFTTMKGHSPLQPPVVMDTFVHTHAELLTKQGLKGEGLELLVSHRDDNQGRISSCRMVCDHVRVYGGGDVLMIPHLLMVVELDDSSNEAIELATLLLRTRKGDGLVWEEVFELVVRYLDYPSNRTNMEAWGVLKQVQEEWLDYKMSDLWTCRLDWWKYLHQPCIATTTILSKEIM